MRIEVLVDVKTTLGEGPLWDVDQQRLYWIDVPQWAFAQGRLHVDKNLDAHGLLPPFLVPVAPEPAPGHLSGGAPRRLAIP